MASRKKKKKALKNKTSTKKKKVTKAKPAKSKQAAKKKKPTAAAARKKTTNRKMAKAATRKAAKGPAVSHGFYEHQVYASSDAYSLVESTDPSELVRQVQIRCNDGWSTVGGVCHSGSQFYQALVRHR